MRVKMQALKKRGTYGTNNLTLEVRAWMERERGEDNCQRVVQTKKRDKFRKSGRGTAYVVTLSMGSDDTKLSGGRL